MKSLKVNLLSNNIIWVGELSHQEDVLQVFYTNSIDLLERFSREHKDVVEDLHKAFAYWVLCKLGRCKESDQHYGTLRRMIVTFSRKLWKQLRSELKKIVRHIRHFQKAILA